MQSTSAGWLRGEGPEDLKPAGETELLQGASSTLTDTRCRLFGRNFNDSIGNGTQNAAIYCAIGSGSSSDVNFEAIRLFERPFLAGVAVMGESGLYGTCRVAAGIVGTADLMLGKGVESLRLCWRAGGLPRAPESGP